MPHNLMGLAEQLGHFLKTNNKKIATAESCTGGWIAQCITEVPGSSAWFDRGFITYSNSAKMQMLGVLPKTLLVHGAVSAETALEMVTGALTHSEADCAIAVTGIAGPDGGSKEKPIGTIYIAWQTKNESAKIKKLLFTGTRQQIREQTVIAAIEGVLS